MMESSTTLSSPLRTATEDDFSPLFRPYPGSTRGLGTALNYATSRWALSCIAMAFILNRTHIFAAPRRRLRLCWRIRVLVRLGPILLLTIQAHRLLQSIQCQTSPEFVQLRWGEMGEKSDLFYSQTNARLNSLSSALLLGGTDQQSCSAIGVHSQISGGHLSLHGSLSLLWPLFGTLCLSQFLETVSCVVQGRLPAAETGMTLFEQSLAFAEADRAINQQLDWGSLNNSAWQLYESRSNSADAISLTRSMILKGENAAPEVLIVAFLSSMTHITSHVLGIFDLQARFRLTSTTFWGICFMSSIAWSAHSFELGYPSLEGLLRFPTVCIIGFIPHVAVLAGIATCLCIYGLALLLSVLGPSTVQGTPEISFRQRLTLAHRNMQANISLHDIRITREMDLTTALLRTGFAAITMASEAVYVNESRGVGLPRRTWLEEARSREVEEIQRQCTETQLPNSGHDEGDIIGLIPINNDTLITKTGFSRERAMQTIPRSRRERGMRVGIGATERSSRWFMVIEFLATVAKLSTKVCALSVVWILGILRVRACPAWLRRLTSLTKRSRSGDDRRLQPGGGLQSDRARHLTLSNGNALSSGRDISDIEIEFRQAFVFKDEESLDDDLYRYWLKGGWWGSNDSSGDFKPGLSDDEWDNTSVITIETTSDAIDADSGSESYNAGQTTTPNSPQMSQDDLSLVDSPLGMGDLARLLQPTSCEEREEAWTLAAHLQSDRVVTRAGFQLLKKNRRTRVLKKPGLQPSDRGLNSLDKSMLCSEAEEHLLEQVLLSQRGTFQSSESGMADRAGAFGESMPPCVVCQSSPRTIIVWPCRCLSLCDDCRVSLATNNFDKCVCCRRGVMSFSRVFVP